MAAPIPLYVPCIMRKQSQWDRISGDARENLPPERTGTAGLKGGTQFVIAVSFWELY